MEDGIIYPEVSFTKEWKEGRRFERERILKLLDNHKIDYSTSRNREILGLKKKIQDVNVLEGEK